MHQNELLEEIRIAAVAMNKISTALASESGIECGNYGYISDKLEAFRNNTVNHVISQAKFIQRQKKKQYLKQSV